MTYSAQYAPVEFGTEVKKCIIQKTQKFEDASENMRKSLVFHMVRGSQMIWHCETMVPDFTKYDNNILPLTNLVFNREKLMTDYKTLVKQHEDKSVDGTPGCYQMHKDFNLGILMNMADPDTDDEIVQMLLDAVPNIDQFKKVYILPEE